MIAPIPFGVGVAMEANFGSCLLLDTLYQYGLSISADEVTRYRQASSVNPDSDNIGSNGNHSLVQWVGDNIDHNLSTLTGSGTFHRMG